MDINKDTNIGQLKLDLAKKCIAAGIVPTYISEWAYFYDSLDSLHREDPDIDQTTIEPGMKIAVQSDDKTYNANGSICFDHVFDMEVQEIVALDEKNVILVGTGLDWTFSEGERVMLSTINFAREYEMERIKSITLDNMEKQQWAERLATSNVPVYQFDQLAVMAPEGHKLVGWPFVGLELAGDVTFTMPVKEIGVLEPTKDFERRRFEQIQIYEQGNVGDVYFLHTSAGYFISYDINQELVNVKEINRNISKEMREALAQRYAEDRERFDGRDIHFASTAGLKLINQHGIEVSPHEVKEGDQISVKYHKIREYDDTLEYDLKGAQEAQQKNELTVQSIWTDGSHVIIETPSTVISTVDFHNELEQAARMLSLQRKPIGERLAHIAAQQNAPSLLFKNIELKDPTTHAKIDASEIQPGQKVEISGLQSGDMRHDGWQCEMNVSAIITVSDIFIGEAGIGIVADNGLVVSTIDFSQDLKQETIIYNNKIKFEQEEAEELYKASIEMDDKMHWDDPRFDSRDFI